MIFLYGSDEVNLFVMCGISVIMWILSESLLNCELVRFLPIFLARLYNCVHEDECRSFARGWVSVFCPRLVLSCLSLSNLSLCKYFNNYIIRGLESQHPGQCLIGVNSVLILVGVLVGVTVLVAIAGGDVVGRSLVPEGVCSCSW